jgi:hypothetical protein
MRLSPPFLALALALAACAHAPREAAPAACGYEASASEARYANGDLQLAALWITRVARPREGVRGPLHVEVIPGVGHSLLTAEQQLHPRAIALTLALAHRPQEPLN